MSDPEAKPREWWISHKFGSSGIRGPDTTEICVVEKRALEEANARIAELEKRLAQFTGEPGCGIQHELFDMVCEERDKYERERVELIAALEYYAAEHNWVSDADADFTEIRNDDWSQKGKMNTGGKRAREALAKVGDDK